MRDPSHPTHTHADNTHTTHAAEPADLPAAVAVLLASQTSNHSSEEKTCNAASTDLASGVTDLPYLRSTAAQARMNQARLSNLQYDLWVAKHLDEINMVIVDLGLAVQALPENHVAYPGFGVFAKRAFKMGEFFEGYLGIGLTHGQLKAKYGSEKAIYVLKLSRGRFICAEDPQTSNFWRFVNSNHGTSLPPNVAPLDIGYGTTLLQIEIGEELLFDYGLGFRWATAAKKTAIEDIPDGLKPPANSTREKLYSRPPASRGTRSNRGADHSGASPGPVSDDSDPRPSPRDNEEAVVRTTIGYVSHSTMKGYKGGHHVRIIATDGKMFKGPKGPDDHERFPRSAYVLFNEGPLPTRSLAGTGRPSSK